MESHNKIDVNAKNYELPAQVWVQVEPKSIPQVHIHYHRPTVIVAEYPIDVQSRLNGLGVDSAENDVKKSDDLEEASALHDVLTVNTLGLVLVNLAKNFLAESFVGGYVWS